MSTSWAFNSFGMGKRANVEGIKSMSFIIIMMHVSACASVPTYVVPHILPWQRSTNTYVVSQFCPIINTFCKFTVQRIS